MQLRVEVKIDAYNERNAYGNLQVSETVNLDSLSFLEIAGILGRFHELSEKIREERNTV